MYSFCLNIIFCLIISGCSHISRIHPPIMNITDIRKGENFEIKGTHIIDLRNKLLLIRSQSHIYQNNNADQLGVFSPDGHFIHRQYYLTIMWLSFKAGKIIEDYEICRTVEGQIVISFGEDSEIYIPDQTKIKEFIKSIRNPERV